MSIEEIINNIKAEYPKDAIFRNEAGYEYKRDEAIELLKEGQNIHTVEGGGGWTWFKSPMA